MIEPTIRKSLFVIPSINGGDLLERMLPTLNLPAETVIVLDQGSEDNTEAVCKAAGVEVVQLGTPHTYTQCCNIGVDLAHERGCKYVFVANNDITFVTDVARELLGAMEADPNLAIAAPSQVIVDEALGERRLSYRAFWHLGASVFEHDFQPPDGNPERLEADFCELTCAALRVSAVRQVDGFDDDYGFYHEDADLGYRLRQAGFSCAYLPKSQIEHFHSSTFSKVSNERKQAYLDNSKKLFARKFGGYGVKHQDHKSQAVNSWNIINRNLHRYLGKFGLIDPTRPELIFSHPGVEPFDYLYTVWETTKFPKEWLAFKDSYKLSFASSRWVEEVLKDAGFDNVHYATLGVETDIFHPWGSSNRFDERTTFFWSSHNQYRKGLDVMLKAWSRFHPRHRNTRLVLMGFGLLPLFGRTPDRVREWKNFVIAEFDDDGISVYATRIPLSDPELASVYRGVDFTVCTSRSEGFGLVVAESMACGTPVITGSFGATAEFAFENALMFGGKPVKADYSDKGFSDVGQWWEPDLKQLEARLNEAMALDRAAYSELSRQGMLLIRNRFTWRNSVMGIRSGLVSVQDRHETANRRKAVVATGPDTPTDVPQEPMPMTSTSSPSGSLAKPAHTLSAPRRHGIAARNLRRLGRLVERFADELEHKGLGAALRVTSSLAASHIRPRIAWAGSWLSRKAKAPLSRAAESAKRQSPMPERDGILFIGYVEASLGLGEALRQLIVATTAGKLEFAIHPFRVNVETRLKGAFMPERYDEAHRYDVNVIAVSPDQLPALRRTLDSRLLSTSYNVLRVFWELPRAPLEWQPLLQGIDELWAPNAFVAEAFSEVFDGPILTIVPHVPFGDEDDLPSREALGLDEDRFYFLFSFDYYSSPQRKNPLGVLEAFERAFGDSEDNVGLVIKSFGDESHHPDIRDRLARAAQQDPRIKLIDGHLSSEQMRGLIKACDCYVSLHRAEGFGLGMAEAMGFGKPVIGTDFSGSRDFLSQKTGFPVPCTLVPVGPGEYHWADDQQWAEPDLDAAVDILREVFENPRMRETRGKAAKAFVQKRFGKEAVGAAIAARYAEIMKNPPETRH